MSMKRMRLDRLERAFAPEVTIPLDYLVDALPPMSATAHARYQMWFEATNGGCDVPDPEPFDPMQGLTDADLAAWVLRTIPSDMIVTADACASLLVEAYWRWDRDRYGEDYAWRDRSALARQLADWFIDGA